MFCLLHVPKKTTAADLKDYKPVSLIKVLETLYSPTRGSTCCSWCSCTFFDFSRAFSILQPVTGGELWMRAVDSPVTSWITDYLTDRLQSA